MNIIEIIKRKRDRSPLTKDEIGFFIESYSKGAVPDYQASALLMSVFLNGMTADETFWLTDAMRGSGDVIDLSEIVGYKVDKHSTGGVGDKISLVLAPLVASCGLFVPMISGRGLGHTGGTLDKLESIPGFTTAISASDFKRFIARSGLAIAGQTSSLVPADRKLYALRDVTGTIESIPLITASILSKKLASGLDGLVMDIKVGSGAFMKTAADAMRLARSIGSVMKKFKKDILSILTDMNQPLGKAIGNSLEVIEAVEVLKGRGPWDILELSLELGAFMLKLGKRDLALPAAKKILAEKISGGQALEKFKEMVANQGGNPSVTSFYSTMPQAGYRTGIKAARSGFLGAILSEKLGYSIARLGAGRIRIEDRIDPAVGLVLERKVGEKVEKGDTLAVCHYNEISRFKDEAVNIESCFKILSKGPAKKKLVLRKII